MEELNLFFKNFRDPLTENAFRNYMLERDKKLTTLAILLMIIPNVLFAYSDLLLFDDSGEAESIFLIRLIYCLISVLAIYLIKKTTNFNFKDYVVLIWVLLTIIHIENINYTRPEDYYYFVIIDTIILILFYLVVSNRFIFQLIPSLIFTLADLILIIFIKEGASVVTLNVIVISYLFVNLVGLLTGRLLHSNKRWQYLVVVDEKKLSKKWADLDADRNKFLAVLSHDLRGPFLSFQGGLEILSEDNFESEEERKQYATNLYDSAKRISNLLENILSWSKIQIGNYSIKYSEFDIATVISQTIKLYDQIISEKRISVNMEIKSNIKLYTDKNIFELVFRNVFSNAIKFSNKSGSISIAAEVKVDNIILLIEDNGIGIPKKIQDNIFNLYADHSTSGTNGELGTGLGLGISFDFMEFVDGEINIESKEGIGTKVYLQFPIVKRKP